MKRTVSLLCAFLLLCIGLLIPAGATGEDSAWREKERGGIRYYENDDGATSALIDDNGIVWLYEESYDNGCWYGLDNSTGALEPGSRFCVRWLTKAADPEAWDAYLAEQEPEKRERLEQEKDPSVLCYGVILPDGREVNPERCGVPLYVEIGEDWDLDDISARFLSEDEERSKLCLKSVRIEGETRHFAELSYEAPKSLLAGGSPVSPPKDTAKADTRPWTVLLIAELLVLVPMVILAVVLGCKVRELRKLLQK